MSEFALAYVRRFGHRPLVDPRDPTAGWLESCPFCHQHGRGKVLDLAPVRLHQHRTRANCCGARADDALDFAAVLDEAA
ncbi:MAG: hypothetical protein QOJ29_4279 [Thermoleophilaceae bacterium]|jgi:hypothetical protein|nr:hypothetical protein [Thermoleophilaceae bacterium]